MMAGRENIERWKLHLSEHLDYMENVSLMHHGDGII